MTYPHRPAGPAPVLRAGSPARRPWTVTPNGRTVRSVPLTRRYETAWTDSGGAIHQSTRIGPAMPAFESAFAAFARGTLIAAPAGPVAIEDLMPGTPIWTRTGPMPVRWVGRMMLPPANMKQDGGPDLFRVTADSFGHNRPAPDLVLCSGARIAHRAGRLAGASQASEVLVPVRDFADDVSVMQLAPMSAVPSFHLVLDRHAVIEANGVAVESFHPGRDTAEALPGDLLALFLSMFPWLHALADFGAPVLPRMGLEQIHSLSAAG